MIFGVKRTIDKYTVSKMKNPDGYRKMMHEDMAVMLGKKIFEVFPEAIDVKDEHIEGYNRDPDGKENMNEAHKAHFWVRPMAEYNEFKRRLIEIVGGVHTYTQVQNQIIQLLIQFETFKLKSDELFDEERKPIQGDVLKNWNFGK